MKIYVALDRTPHRADYADNDRLEIVAIISDSPERALALAAQGLGDGVERISRQTWSARIGTPWPAGAMAVAYMGREILALLYPTSTAV